MANRSQQSNPNPNPRDQRVRDLPGPRATPSPVRVTCLRRRSPDFAAQWSRLLAAPGHRGRVCGARKRGSVHGRLDGGALTLWRARAGEQAATAPSRPLRQATMASGRRRCVAWREKGEERMMLGFGARRRRRGFVLAKTADDRPIEINGRESVSSSGPASGPGGRGRGRRGGPFRRPGRWLSGLGPKEGWPSRPRAGFAPGLLNSVFCFIVFSIFPEAISIAF